MTVKCGMTDVVGFPCEETDKTMDAMQLAEQKGDIDALRWCARRLCWLYDQAEIISSDTYCYTVTLFNVAWLDALKYDPPPASIAALVDTNRKPGAPTGEAAGEALDTLKTFFEESMANGKLPDVRKALDDLRGVVTAIGAKE